MKVTWLDDGTEIDPSELGAQGIIYRELPVEAEAHKAGIDTLCEARGYSKRDVVDLRPDTEGLDEILAKFDKEHFHEDDEVRFVLEGEGIFDIRSIDDRWMHVLVEAGDLIVVPEGRFHRFELTEARTIRCLRLFVDPGWAAVYREAA